MTLPPTVLVDMVVSQFGWAKGGRWAPLAGGRTNYTWKLSPVGNNAPVVVKLYRGPALNPLFPNDPGSEAKLLQVLSGTGWAPQLLSSLKTPVGDCNIYSHLPGQTWARDTAAVGTLMRGLHDVECPEQLRVAPDGSTEISTKTESILAKCGTFEGIASVRPEGVVQPSGQRVLLHSDIVPGNLILNSKGLHLIDWQCPSIGDPCEDIAIFLSPAMQSLYRGSSLTTDEVSEFFKAYRNPAVETRYYALAPWYHWRMSAYCQWQSENGRRDYSDARDLELSALQRSFNR